MQINKHYYIDKTLGNAFNDLLIIERAGKNA